jgi:hypothetical protein
MLIVALVLAVIGLAALVTAVVTSNELIAWVCIAASVIGVVLLIIDALRERSRPDEDAPTQQTDDEIVEDYPDEPEDDAEAETTAAPTETVDSDAEKVTEEDSNPR